MTKIMDRVVNDVQELSQSEKNNLLKYLIASMDDTHDSDSEEQWAKLVQDRYNDLESGKVQTATWDQIKTKVL